ncbi:MAG TPA: FAD-binding oxidoreductase [Devosia sp.]|jgi:FAD/FMN-containing dehydrogenase|uniref:FAD-binding oxidoreductase n=1 Tax=Devosia sp. TaxID=1871048 RepID=UPI002DDD575D|nr:FAD-binding oxidoreductase [Devosia sp.]HEV2518336.1 FAD-binding oxidoreductase [Devosia sp.]
MDKRFPLEDQIDMLAASLRGRVVTRRDTTYDEMRTVALGNFDRRPVAVIRVANVSDVAAVINFARATDLELAVRSGGHSVGGHSGTEGGLVIDLRDLNSIEIDGETSTVWAGTGLTSGEVTRAVEQHGLIVGFGDSGTVGIGGLTLGGGIGYMVRKHGLTIDCLLAAEVVTAAGDIVIADAGNHPDLFWALRGGGGNFGVVTRLKFKLHPLPAFVGGPLVLPATAENIVKFAALADAAPEALSTIAMVMPIPPVPFVPAEFHGRLALIGMMAFSGPADAATAALAPFRAIATPIADLVGPAPYSAMYAMDPPPEMRPAVSCRSRFVDQVTLETATKMLAALEACPSPMKMGQVRVLGGAYSRVPTDATAFAHRHGKVMLGFLAMYEGGADVTAHFDRWATDAIESVSQKNAVAYVNFLGIEGGEGLRAAYPGSTWDRLRQIKAKYDPQNLFRLNQNIPPAA